MLCYDFFTVAHDQARLSLEFARRERFVEFLVAPRSSATRQASFTTFRPPRSKSCRRKPEGTTARTVSGGLWSAGQAEASASMACWTPCSAGHAKRACFPRQRNRAHDRQITDGRDYIAHGAGDHLLTPVESSRVISDTAEIVNQLWGEPTSGGRLHPAPIRRLFAVRSSSPGGARAKQSWPGMSRCLMTGCRSTGKALLTRLSLPCQVRARSTPGPGSRSVPSRTTKDSCDLTRYPGWRGRRDR